MKGILVIDLPDDFLADPSNAYRLQIGGDAKVYYVTEGEKRGSIIGDTRDIKPMPTKKKPLFDPDHCDIEEEIKIVHEIIGYNRCIDEIMGETDGWRKENETVKSA